MTFTEDLATGFATTLAAALPGVLTWSAYGYPDDTGGAVPIYVPVLPHDRDRAVGLLPYPVEDNPLQTHDIWAVQVRVRGVPDDLRSVTRVEDQIFNAMNGLRDTAFGAIHVTLVWRNSSVPMGMDANRRHEWSSNYYLHITRPTIHRAD